MTENNIQENLILFIRKRINDYKLLITADSLLENDLGITGEDASELIIAFSKTYKVNIDNFIFLKYFNEEPNAFINQSADISPLTVNDLEKAIKAGRLDGEVINS